jgi:D-lactate dehydrogenase (cytochrome)
MSGMASYKFPNQQFIFFSVPVSRLPELVHETKQDLLESNLRSTIVGHVGDGNFHALILFDGEQELAAVSDAVHRLVHRAIKLDGTCQLYTRFCIVEI